MSCCSNEAQALGGLGAPGPPGARGSTAAAEAVEETAPANREVAALAIAAFLAGNSVLVTVVANVGDMAATTRFHLQTGLLVATLLVALLLAPQLGRSVAANLLRRELSTDALFVLGWAGALGFSLVAYARGVGPVYFEVGSVLMVIYCVGSLVKRTAQRRVLKALDSWSPAAQLCRRVDGEGRLIQVPVMSIVTGDLVQVPAGDAVPVDGVVREGEAFVREATMTGEPHLRAVGPGDSVLASALLVDAALRVEATAPGADRQVDRVRSVLEAARSAPSRWQTQAESVARVFTPAVAVLALLAFVTWAFISGPSAAVMVALSVLLVACPCAFGFATPVSIWVTLSRLAGSSLVVRRADAIERLARVDTVIFDKTGTLTALRPEIHELIVREGQPYGRETILALASSVEAHSHHPIASVFVSSGAVVRPALLTESMPAIGVRGRVEVDGAEVGVEVGRLDRLHRPCCDAEFLLVVRARERAGQQPLAIRVDGQLVAVALVEEVTIDTFDDGLLRLRALGVDVKVYSGDRGSRVERLGVADAFGAMTPDDKAREVRALRAAGHEVLFVGDGVNDVGAMGDATASMAVADGAGMALESADIVWHGGDLRSVEAGIVIARRSVQRLRRALLFAVTYNSAGMVLAALGWLHPVLAVLLMTASSLTVVLHAADLRWEEGERVPSTRKLKEPPDGGLLPRGLLPPPIITVG
ncbi:Copper-transporting P-type ATPase [Planctomycetes bacterium Poly30]|uniref:Copper-transporting P-type ATPase n=1 Tax=Saltatorellus ferox TaxID=2528018 RepID=A0A518EVI2_9BACT|nr:Copper-transporting P-type ATPase [Planctomycetes bacterium Poly30]